MLLYHVMSDLINMKYNIFLKISNLEKIIEVQNSMFTAAVEELTSKLKAESEKRQALQAEVEKLAHCVTQV